MPKYPNIVVSIGSLYGPEGNAFVILGKVTNALKEYGISKEIRDDYMKAATYGDYENLLKVTREWVFLDIDE